MADVRTFFIREFAGGGSPARLDDFRCGFVFLRYGFGFLGRGVDKWGVDVV